MNKVAVITIWIFFCFFVMTKNSSADWQSDLEAEFDIVETFDGLQDWLPAYQRGSVADQSKMPKKLNDSPSIWNSYTYWPLSQSADYWIKNHGAENVWQGTGKSLILDMSQSTEAGSGPSRLRTYFGGQTADSISPYTNSGIEESGYRGDVYIFEMIKLPTNIFPLQETLNQYNTYYKYFSYFKFNVLATGKTNVSDCTEGRPDCEYGASNIHTMFSVTDSGHPHFKLDYYSDADWADLNLPVDGFQKYSPTNPESFLDSRLGDWFGLEIHVHRGDPGVANGYQEYWLYDENGNVSYVGRTPADYMMMTANHNWGFNYFFQGGNISFQPDVDSQGLDTTYYMDDLVIDNNRIGPVYFNLLGLNIDVVVPASPSGLSVI